MCPRFQLTDLIAEVIKLSGELYVINFINGEMKRSLSSLLLFNLYNKLQIAISKLLRRLDCSNPIVICCITLFLIIYSTINTHILSLGFKEI